MEILNSHITINVKDLDQSIQFYEKIGFHLQQKWGNHYAQLTAKGIEIGLHPSSNPSMDNHQAGISIGLTSKDFKATKEELLELGISVTERNEEGGGFLHFNDPDGTALYFIQPKW